MGAKFICFDNKFLEKNIIEDILKHFRKLLSVKFKIEKCAWTDTMKIRIWKSSAELIY